MGLSSAGGGYTGFGTRPNGATFGTSPGFHSGGIVGRGAAPVRIVNSGIFSNAPRLHKGGLASNEVPAILEKGEGVFTQEQMASMGKQEISIVNVVDSRQMDAYLATPRGKQSILNVIGTSQSTVKRMLR